MFGGDAGQANWLSAAITVIAVVAIITLRNRQPRRLRLGLLWIRPLVLWLALGLGLVAAPPPMTVAGIALVVAGLGAGAALGWQRGRMMRIEVDPAAEALTVQASPMGVAFILAFVVLRVALRTVSSERLLPGGFPVLALPSALLALGVGLMSLQAVEMWIRARRLLAEAKPAIGLVTGGPAGGPPPA